MHLPDTRAIRAIASERWRAGDSSSRIFERVVMTLDRAFEALADPTRRSLLRRLADGPSRAGDLAKPFEISRPAVSRHLRVLREADLVEVEAAGRTRLYRLSPEGLAAVREWMVELNQMWDKALAAFKKQAEARR